MMQFNLLTIILTHFTNQGLLRPAWKYTPPSRKLHINIQEFKGLHNINNFPPSRSHSWRRTYLRHLNCIETRRKDCNWGTGHFLNSLGKVTLN